MDFTEDARSKSREGCWKCLKTPSTTEWISCSVSMSICVFLLHLSFSEECEKCWEEDEREREIDRTLSLCFHNRTASSTWRPLRIYQRASFPRASSPRISFFLSDSRRFTPHFDFPPFDLRSFLPVEVEADKINAQSRRVQLRSSIFIYSDVFCARRWE